MAFDKSRKTRSELMRVRSRISDARELPGSYSVLISGLASPIPALMKLLSLEKLACWHVKIELGDREPSGAVWIQITGDVCTKEFLGNKLVDKGKTNGRSSEAFE